MNGRMKSRGSWIPPLMAFGVAGPIVFWLILAILGLLTPGYDHVSGFISSLGAKGDPYAVVQRLNFAFLGASLLALTVGFQR